MEFYIDFGSGYELIPNTEYSHSLNITLQNENFIRQRATLAGSITFWGQAKTDIETQQAADFIELPVKVELESNLQGEFYMQLFGAFDEKRNTVTFANFTTNDVYKDFLPKLDYKQPGTVLNLAGPPYTPFFLRYDTYFLYIQSECTNLTFTQWANDYDIEGNPVSPSADPRWSYFVFDETITTGCPIGESIHIWFTRVSHFPYSGYTAVTFNGQLYYMDTGASPQTIDYALGFSVYPIKQAIAAVASFAGITTINYSANAETYGELATKYIGQTAKLLGAEIVSDDIQEVSLNDMLRLLQNTFQMDWYLSDTDTLEIISVYDKISGANVDLSAFAANSKAYNYAGENLPRFEIIKFSNGLQPDFHEKTANIEYPRNNADSVMYENLLFSVDIFNLLRNPGTVDKNGFTLLHCFEDPGVGNIVESGTGIVDTGTIYNYGLANSILLDTYYKVWRYASKASYNGATAEAVTKRPLYQHSGINLALYPSEVDLSNTFVIDSVDHYGQSYNFDLKTRKGTIIVVK